MSNYIGNDLGKSTNYLRHHLKRISQFEIFLESIIKSSFT